jgi:arylsulfatase
MSAPTSARRSHARGGRFALVVALCAALAACGEDAPKGPPNVVVWLVDTLRADRTSAYGYERPTTPNLEALAERGVLFEEFHTHSNWTQPSVLSLFTGTHPLVFPREFARSVPPALITAPEWFSDSGYQTVGLTATIATSAQFGFDQGFDTYLELDAHLDARAREWRDDPVYDAENVVARALEWIDGAGRDGDRPFYMYLHTMDPHLPIRAREELGSFAPAGYTGPFDGSAGAISRARRNDYRHTPADAEHMRGLYDDEVRYNDAWLGRFVEGLQERGLWQDTLLVIVADHGEELFERGEYGHGQANLHTELTHVPFVAVWEGVLPRGKRVERLVRGIDFLPTVVEFAGLDAMPTADGVSVAGEVFGTRAAPAEAPAVAIDRAKAVDDVLALRTTSELYVSSPAASSFGAFEHLHDLAADPLELTNVAARRPQSVAAARAHLAAWQVLRRAREAAFEGGGDVELSAEARAQLKALGYMDEDTPAVDEKR